VVSSYWVMRSHHLLDEMYELVLDDDREHFQDDEKRVFAR
jgi:hypothetical protein